MGRRASTEKLPVPDVRVGFYSDGRKEASRSNKCLKTKKPQCGNTEASGNVETSLESNVMQNTNTAVSNVIPFNFGKQQVRTLLMGEQPWFVAADVCASLSLSNVSLAVNGRADRDSDGLDDDEKGIATVNTPSGAQEMLVVNESGLYSLIFKSRKSEAKRFKKWVTAEVLPAIRKHGRYEDSESRMSTLIGQTIGTDGFHMLGSLIKGKIARLPAPLRRSAMSKIWSQTHAAFGVRSAEDIPADQLDSARNFIAAYVVIEGDYIPREPAKQERLNIHFPIQALAGRRPGMLTERGDGSAWLDVSLEDVGYQHDSLCELIIFELQRAGYVVDAAQWELATYRNKLRGIDSFVRGLNKVVDEPQRYIVTPGEAA